MGASGALSSISFNGRLFSCKSDDSVMITLNGYTKEVIAHGNGSSHDKMTVQVGSIGGLNLYCDDALGDYEYLVELQSSTERFTVNATDISGREYAGSMTFTEKLELNKGEQMVAVTLEGDLERV